MQHIHTSNEATEALEGLKQPPSATLVLTRRKLLRSWQHSPGRLLLRANPRDALAALREALEHLRTTHVQTVLTMQLTEDKLAQHGYKPSVSLAASLRLGEDSDLLDPSFSNLNDEMPQSFSPSVSLSEIGISSFSMSALTKCDSTAATATPAPAPATPAPAPIRTELDIKAHERVVAPSTRLGTDVGLNDHQGLSLIHISEPTRLLSISYAVFCL